MNASQERRIIVEGRRPLLVHPFFVSIGGTLLIAAFATDIMYSQTALMQWSNASEWLIAAGLLLALVASLVLLIERLSGRAGPISWLDFALLAAAALLSLVNVFVHSRDAWTSVVPQGIWLSGIVALLLLVVGIRGWSATQWPIDREGERA